VYIFYKAIYIFAVLPSQCLQRANCQGLGFCSADNGLPSNAWHTCHPALYPRQSPRRCRCLLQCQLGQQTPTPMLNKQITATLTWMFWWYSYEFDYDLMIISVFCLNILKNWYLDIQQRRTARNNAYSMISGVFVNTGLGYIWTCDWQLYLCRHCRQISTSRL